jgi:putative MATE family efflux protein
VRHLHRGDAVGRAEAPAVPVGSRRELIRTTWALAWPAILSFSLESIVGFGGLLMVGHLGPVAVAAVGVGVQILFAVNSVLFAFGTGALAIVARHVGAGQRRDAEETLRQSIVSGIAAAVLVALPVIVFARPIVWFFRVEPAVVEETVRFLRIAMGEIPGLTVVFVVAASLRGAGDTRTPLLIGGIVTVLDLLTAYLLIYGRLGLPALGVVGAGLASPIAFTVGAAVSLALLARGTLRLVVRWRDFRFDGALVRRVLRVGYPAALEHLLMQIGFFTYVVFVAAYGTGPVAAYFIGARVLSLSFLPGLGFATAAGALVGQHLGAGQPRRAEESGWAAQAMALAMMSSSGVMLFASARPIARLFVDDPAVVEAAVSFIQILAVCQPLMAVDFVMSGALRGAGDTRFPLLTALIAFWVCRLGSAWLVTHVFRLDLEWLWRVVVLDFAVRAGLKSWRFRAGTWQRLHV